MKRNIITIMMALAALLMAQCKKQAEQQSNEPATPTMEVKVRVENATSKTEITATGVASWKQGDKLYVVGESQGLLGYVSARADGDPVTFTGTITALTSAQTLRFYYVGDKSFTLNGSNYTFDLGSQDGSLAGIAAHNQLAFGKTTSTIAVGTIDFGTITMTSLMSIAHLNINDGGNAVAGPVTVTGGFATSTFNAKAYDGSALTGTAGNITMTFASGTASTNCYLALLPGTQTLKFTEAGGGKVATLAEKDIAANTFYNAGSAVEVAVTPKPIEFTVNAKGTKVKFSPGNLQYLGSSDGTGTWRFAEHQWDYMGDGPNTTTGNKGNVDLGTAYEGKYNTGSGTAGPNENDADKAAARDLFGWGCTGYQDTRTSSTGYQKNYQPYSTSETAVDGASSVNNYGYGPDYDATNKYGLSVENYSDWGCVTGLPSAGEDKSWRTLSKDEWEYLLNTSGASSGARTDVNRFAKAMVNDVKGLLIFPDGYELPEGYTTADGGTGMAKVNKTSSSDAPWPSQNIPDATWTSMESSGVVFLPAAGSRDVGSVSSVGSIGIYWSSSCANNSAAYYLTFSSNLVFPRGSNSRRYGRSVRLVSEN